MTFFHESGPWAWAIAVVLAVIAVILFLQVIGLERTVENRDKRVSELRDDRQSAVEAERKITRRVESHLDAALYFAPQLKRAFRTKRYGWDGNEKRFDPDYMTKMYKIAKSNDEWVDGFDELGKVKSILNSVND